MRLSKIILCFLLMFVTSFVVGQECKYERNEVDKFTNKTIKETKRVTVYASKLDPQSKSMFFRFEQVDSTHFISVSKWYSDIISISEGDKLMMIFQDGEQITIKCLKYAIATPYSGKWHIDINFYIPKEELKSMQTKNITDIRIYTTSGYIEEKVAIKNAEKIKQFANCIN